LDSDLPTFSKEGRYDARPEPEERANDHAYKSP
jgi:hypothetical protein